MQSNISVTNDLREKNINKKAAKVAKLSTFERVRENTDKLMLKAESAVAPQPTISATVNSNDVKVPEENNAKPVAEEPKVAQSTALPLTSEEAMIAKKDTLGIEAYLDIDSENIKLTDYQSNRRLRVNEVVSGNANRARNILGVERKISEPELNEPEVSNEVELDNSDISNQEETTLNIEKVESEPYNNSYDNNTEIDNWLNKENVSESTGISSPDLDEIKNLVKTRNDTASFLAAQKEILANLRQSVEQDRVLCENKKKELVEENQGLTKELTMVLEQIKLLEDERNAYAGLGINSGEPEEKSL